MSVEKEYAESQLTTFMLCLNELETVGLGVMNAKMVSHLHLHPLLYQEYQCLGYL